jgi:two-component system phosphate regulon sensor histidine kinase PhoR
MPSKLIKKAQSSNAEYEHITRNMRWLEIAAVFITLPFGAPQTLALVIWLLLITAFNMSRYLDFAIGTSWFGSRISMLIVDNLFVVGLLFLAGSTSLPYTGFLVLMIMSATYWYGLKGTISVLGGQLLILAYTTSHPIYPALEFDGIRLVALILMVLLIIGLFIERLTRVERLDHTALAELSAENRLDKNRLLALVNSLNDATLVLNDKGTILLSNKALKDLASLQSDPRGRDFLEILPLKHRLKGKINRKDLLKPEPQHRRDLNIGSHDGNELELDLTISPVQLETIKSLNYIVICRDITKEKSLDQQREEFIAVASHELRTPLSILEAALSTALLSKDVPAPVIMLIQQAHRNTLFLAGLVKDLTTLSDAQNDTIAIALKPVDPGVLLARLIVDYQPIAIQSGLTITSHIKPGTPAILSTEHHVQEILRNFIGNSLKYTKTGGIKLIAQPSDEGGVLFMVEDTGIGISKSDLKQLFTKFYRAEDYRSRETGGTGLGLYLCSELAQRINAKVWCTSVLNKGSIFYLELPAFSELDRDSSKVVAAKVSTLIDQL